MFWVNPSTTQPEGLGLLRVDPERCFFPHLKRQGLAPPNGSTKNSSLSNAFLDRLGHLVEKPIVLGFSPQRVRFVQRYIFQEVNIIKC